MLINNIRKSPTCPIRNTIHAPTRGATSAVAWKWKLHIISIHAPTRGATPYGLLTANVRLFQSTLLQEERLAETLRSGESTVISIHAPTRGATLSILRVSFSSKDFNPRSYKRSDLVNFAAFSVTIIFQSTLLQEERPSPAYISDPQ